MKNKNQLVSIRAAGYSLQPGHLPSLPAPNFQPTATQERDGQCSNQHHSRELLMMYITVPETCWAYRKYNKTISSIYLVLILQLLFLYTWHALTFLIFLNLNRWASLSIETKYLHKIHKMTNIPHLYSQIIVHAVSIMTLLSSFLLF